LSSVLDPPDDPAAEWPFPGGAIELAHLTRLLTDPATVLGPYDDDVVGRGIWSLFDSGGAASTLLLADPTLPLDDRLAATRAIGNLYADLFVPRCQERLGHRGEQEGWLEMACYMLWDLAAFAGEPGSREGNLLEDAILDVLERALRLPHVACQESALHGLGHRVARHPDRVPMIIDRWLRAGGARNDQLREYARAARSGCVQ